MMPAMTSRDGATRMRASGRETAVVAMLKATRCARPVHVLTAKTEAGRSRVTVTAAENGSRALPGNSDGCRKRSQCVFAIANGEYSGQGEAPVQRPARSEERRVGK